MKYRCRLTITAVCLTAAFFTASAPVRSFAAEVSSSAALESGMETAPEETVETASEETVETTAEAMTEETMEETGEDWPAEPSIVAPSGVLMEASTGTVLYDKNMHEQHYPASITKIMTLLLIFEALEEGDIDLQDEVMTSAYAQSMGGSQVFLEEGEWLSADSQYRLYQAAAFRRLVSDAFSQWEHGDIRLIFAVSRPLDKIFREGKIRADLFYLLKGLTLDVPPLVTGRKI